jgi:transposase-like protein
VVSHPSINTNRVVVALLDGRRLKGFVYDFVPSGDTLNIFPSAGDPQDKRPATVVEFTACKAIFFVRSHLGNPQVAAEVRRAAEDPRTQAPRGKKVKIVFSDGEEMTACTEVYSPKRFGFFVYPLDPRSNNLRIFIVNANVRKVLTAKALDATANRLPERDRVVQLPPTAPGEAPEAASQDLKCEAALRVLNGESPLELGREYGVPAEDVTFWTRAFLQGGRGELSEGGVTGEAATNTLVTAMKARIRALEREIEKLKERRAAAVQGA